MDLHIKKKKKKSSYSVAQCCADQCDRAVLMEKKLSAAPPLLYIDPVSTGSVHFISLLLSERVLVCPITGHFCFWKALMDWLNCFLQGCWYHRSHWKKGKETGPFQDQTLSQDINLLFRSQTPGKMWQPWLWRGNGKISSPAEGLVSKLGTVSLALQHS